MKTIVSSIVFCFSLSCSFAQTFNWAQCVIHNGVEYISATTGPDHSITVIGKFSQLNMSYGEEKFYDAHGEVKLSQLYGRNYFIANFEANGRLTWYKFIYHVDISLEKVISDREGNYYVLALVEGQFVRLPEKNGASSTNDEYDEEYDDDEDEEEGDEDLPLLYGKIEIEKTAPYLCRSGYNLLKFSSDGKFINSTLLDVSFGMELEIGELLWHPNGNFLLSGFTHEGKFSASHPAVAGSGGANFIAMFSTSGKLIWADVIKNPGRSCCTFQSELCHLTLSPNGTIFYTGTLYESGIFGGKEVVTTRMPYVNSNSSSDLMDVFIASYTSNGELRWVKSAGASHTLPFGMAASETAVYLSVQSYNQRRLFETMLDTTNGKNSFLIRFSADGELKQVKCMNTPVLDLFWTPDQRLDVFGDASAHGKKNRFFDPLVTFAERDQFFLASLDENMDVKSFYSYKLLVSRNNEQTLIRRDDGNYYMWGQLFGGLPIEANKLDKAFKEGKIYGSAPFVGLILRSKFTE